MIKNALVDTSVSGAPHYTCFQFERNGFFSVDPDSTSGKVTELSSSAYTV